jgi:hypothetical protein
VNAITAFPATLRDERFDAAIARVNEWRGRCLDAFSRAEFAVTECLLAMASDPVRGKNIKLPHLIGQRYEALAAAVGEAGLYAAEGRKVAAALSRLRQHDALRSVLCHGVGEVTLSRSGQWTLVLRLVSLRARRAEESVSVVQQEEGERTRDMLVGASRQLCAHLATLKAALSS